MVSPVITLRPNTPPTSRPAAQERGGRALLKQGMPARMICFRRRSMNGTPELPCTFAAMLRILPGLVDDVAGIVAAEIETRLL